MITYLDKILYLYPDIKHVVYWHTKQDGSKWADPYDGIIWENKEIRKPTKEELDKVNDNLVYVAKLKKEQEANKSASIDLEEPISDMQKQLKELQDIIVKQHSDVTDTIKQHKADVYDLQSGFFAVKGFLMMLPDIKKLLEEINAKLPGKNE